MYYYGFIKKINPYSDSSLQGEGVCVLGCLGILVGVLFVWCLDFTMQFT